MPTYATYDLRHDAPRYVAEALKITGQQWVTVDDLAANYELPKPNNLAEIKAEIKAGGAAVGDEHNVKYELIFDALERICCDNSNAIEHDEDYEKYRLLDGADAEQLVDINNQPLIRGRRLPDLFTPETGKWADNVRSYTRDGLRELRESMKAVGWLRELPAIADEYGVVIVGHRRLDVAKQLGIEPVIVTVRFGDGDKGEAARAALAIASNVGAEKISAADRKKIAADLYGSGWSMAKIGELLKVATMTVSRDLRNLTTLNPPPDKPKRGRPRKPKDAVPPKWEPKPEPNRDLLADGVPGVPWLAPKPELEPAPGGLTENTSGQTGRVAEALEKARAVAESTPAPQPPADEMDDEVRVAVLIKQIGSDLDRLGDLIAAMDPEAKLRVLAAHIDEIQALNNEKLRRVFNEVQGKKTRKRAVRKPKAAKPAAAADTSAEVLRDITQGLSGVLEETGADAEDELDDIASVG